MDEKDKLLFLGFVKASQEKRHPAGERRLEKYRANLKMCHEIAGGGLVAMTKDFPAFKKAILCISSDKQYSFNTKKDLKRILAMLYTFKTKKEPSLKYADKEVKELAQHDAKASDKRLAKEIITRDEMRAMLKHADTMDRAIIALLFESGARIGEFEQLKKSDITQIKEGLEVRIPPGKTGERKVVIVEAKKYVNDWLDCHPSKAEDAPLWTTPKSGREIKGPAIAKRISLVTEKMNAARKAKGILLFMRSVNPHNFRHSRASELGGEPGMTEQLLCKYFGWEIGSDMPRTYLHLTDAQLKNAVLNTYGRAKKEAEKKIETHWVCLKCSQQSPLAANYCGTCGQPKDSENEITRIGELEERLAKMETEMKQLARDRVIRDRVKARGQD